MGWALRIISALLGIIILFGGLLAVSIILGYAPGGFSIACLAGGGSIYLVAACLAAFIGMMIVIFSLAGGKKKSDSGIVGFTELGEYRISFKAIESIILTAAKKVRGIREINTYINTTQQGLIIYLRIQPIPELPIPALVAELQETIKEHVQEISGSNVVEVKVLIENISQEIVHKNLR
jgi:uncharacterized alkaline shock family protein YloU